MAKVGRRGPAEQAGLFVGLLEELGREIRAAVIGARRLGSRRLASVAGSTQADTIYRIDRFSEGAIVAWFADRWPATWPVQVVMEGIEDDTPLTFPRGVPVAATALKCILDPIDGTRNLMYDKRPAWALAGLAPQRGAQTDLMDIFVSVMTELPTANQGWAEQWSAVRGGPVRGRRADLRTGRSRLSRPRLATAGDCRHGFASLVKFFPEGKELTARVEERLWGALYGAETKGGGTPLVFEDQYTTTGGQLYEILAGHDRMIGDLRPLVHRRLGITSALVCHPYDICTELILREAGGVVEDPRGGPVRAPLDTTSPVAWIAYANPLLASRLRPVLRRILVDERLL